VVDRRIAVLLLRLRREDVPPGDSGVSRTAVSVLTAVATLGYTLLLFPSGAAVDGFGEKRVMLAGCGAATTLALLAVRRG
jgi:MFS family permease